MFVTIHRINEDNEVKELVVNTEEIVFLSETKPHINYDKPTEFADVENENGNVESEPVQFETEPRYLIGFKNGRHPQFLDKENYEILKKALGC